MNFASLFRSFYCAHKEMFYSLLAMRYIFKDYNTIFFLNFLLRVPTCFMLLLILKKEGGCWWPQQWRFTWKNQLSLLLYWNLLPKHKKFHKSKLCYGQIEYIMPYPINDILFQPFSIPIVCFLRLSPYIYISHYLVFSKIK